MRLSFTRHDGPADFEIMSNGKVVVTELPEGSRVLVVEHSDGSQLAILETSAGFTIRHSGEKDDLYYSSIVELKNAWPAPPVIALEAGEALHD